MNRKYCFFIAFFVMCSTLFASELADITQQAE